MLVWVRLDARKNKAGKWVFVTYGTTVEM